MGVSESPEGRYLQNLSQVIKSNVCPLKDRSKEAERVFFFLRNKASVILYFAGGWSLLLPTVSHLRAAIGFRWCFPAFHCLTFTAHILMDFWVFFVAPYASCFYILWCWLKHSTDLVEICDLMLYLMDLHRHLFHSLFNRWLKHVPRRDVFVKCRFPLIH